MLKTLQDFAQKKKKIPTIRETILEDPSESLRGIGEDDIADFMIISGPSVALRKKTRQTM